VVGPLKNKLRERNNMKKQDLIDKGLTEEQATFVMAEHGKLQTSTKKQIDDLTAERDQFKTQVADRDKDLAELKEKAGSNDTLKQQYEDLQTKYDDAQKEFDTRVETMKRDAALDSLLGENKARNPKAIKALLDADKIVYKDGELSGVSEQLEGLKKSDAYLFDLGTSTGGTNPKGGQSPKAYDSIEAALAADDIDGYINQTILENGGNE
jgi:chromosome segregation ATPase